MKLSQIHVIGFSLVRKLLFSLDFSHTYCLFIGQIMIIITCCHFQGAHIAGIGELLHKMAILLSSFK